MLRWIFRRLGAFVPATVFLLALAFGLLADAPENSETSSAFGGPAPENPLERRRIQKKWREKHHFHLPVFYFSIQSQAVPARIREIPDPSERRAVRNLALSTGAGEATWHFYNKLLELQQKLYEPSLVNAKNIAIFSLQRKQVEVLLTEKNPHNLGLLLDSIASCSLGQDTLWTDVCEAWNQLRAQATPWRRWIPTVRWHGDCRLHRWLWGTEHAPGLMRGHLGLSLTNGRPVASILLPRFRFTLWMSLMALLLVWLLGVAGGLAALQLPKAGSAGLRLCMYALLAIPPFALGAILITFLTNETFLNWFPSYGLGDVPTHASWVERIHVRLAHLILPLTCWSAGGVAYFFLQGQQAARSQQQNLWFTAALARGLPSWRILACHVGPVVLTPLLTLSGHYFPALLGGSVILENLFNLPGMGHLVYHSILMGDYPVVMAVLLTGTLTTLVAYLVTDCLSALFNPLMYLENRG
ncbi:MAG: ABC transporter permease [Flavobacteriales bacterium]|nr:ABC transporter permease [Flavobacteriales bacterium]